MASRASRIAAVAREIFGTLPNRGVRTGLQFLKKPLTGPYHARWYDESIEPYARRVSVMVMMMFNFACCSAGICVYGCWLIVGYLIGAISSYIMVIAISSAVISQPSPTFTFLCCKSISHITLLYASTLNSLSLAFSMYHIKLCKMTIATQNRHNVTAITFPFIPQNFKKDVQIS